MSLSLQSVYEEAIRRLAAASVPSPRMEARLLIAYALKKGSGDFSFYSYNVSAQEADEINRILERRIDHNPLCKIIGRKPFYKNDFIVSDDVLSPRPDTEILVENAIDIARRNSLRDAVDFGTGSGCIILSLLADVPGLSGTGVDISPAALKIARKNAAEMRLENRVSFLKGSWTDSALPDLLGKKFDLMLSNPPYIRDADIAGLEPEVKYHDPLLALEGGADGLRDYRVLSRLAPLILKPGAYILLEVGIGQTKDVAGIFTQQGFILEKTVPDLSGVERCLILHN